MRRVPLALVLLAVAGRLAAGQAPAAQPPPQPPPAAPAPALTPVVAAGGFIYLSGVAATDPSGKVIEGDIKAQTHRVLDTLAARLKEAGSSLDNVVSATVYLTDARDFPAMNETYQSYWTKDLPTRSTVITELVVPGARVEISMIAVPNGGERQVILPAEWSRSPNPYSYAIKSGDTLFLAGLVARTPRDNSMVTGDITAQTKTVLDNAGALLQAAGMGYGDIVASRVYLANLDSLQDMNLAYRTCFPRDPPARVTVRAGLTAPQYLVEITFTAVKTAARTAITTPNPDGSAGRPNPNFSSAIRAGNRLFVSGMLGTTGNNKQDVKEQTREALARIARTLQTAGFAWNDVVDANVFLTDPEEFGVMNEAYREPFAQSRPPARATVVSGLVASDGMVEIAMTAVKR